MRNCLFAGARLYIALLHKSRFFLPHPRAGLKQSMTISNAPLIEFIPGHSLSRRSVRLLLPLLYSSVQPYPPPLPFLSPFSPFVPASSSQPFYRLFSTSHYAIDTVWRKMIGTLEHTYLESSQADQNARRISFHHIGLD